MLLRIALLLVLMTAKVWKFLLPGSGSHTVRVDHLGTDEIQVEIDGVPSSLPTQRCVFTGPANSLCEVRYAAQDWLLYVNGVGVEDYSPSRGGKQNDQSLRQLRSRPDGSYLIQTEIDATEVDLNLVRKYRFVAHGELHEVHVAHYDWIWQVVLDGALVDRVAHKRSENNGEAHFEVPGPGGSRLPAAVSMEWKQRGSVWQYAFAVAGTDVPAYWTQAKGGLYPPVTPIIIAADLPPGIATLEEEEQAVTSAPLSPPPAPAPEQLPQGVSYDASSDAYQANIRAQTGRFVFLGEFRTPEEAHEKYLEAIPLHCPSKALAPGVPP